MLLCLLRRRLHVVDISLCAKSDLWLINTVPVSAKHTSTIQSFDALTRKLSRVLPFGIRYDRFSHVKHTAADEALSIAASIITRNLGTPLPDLCTAHTRVWDLRSPRDKIRTPHGGVLGDVWTHLLAKPTSLDLLVSI